MPRDPQPYGKQSRHASAKLTMAPLTHKLVNSRSFLHECKYSTNRTWENSPISWPNLFMVDSELTRIDYESPLDDL
jgi:hypothetical protein